MIWLAWRQFRTSAYVVIGLLVAIGAAYLITGPHLAHVYDTVVKTCSAHGDCPSVTSSFTGRDKLLQDLSIVLLMFPVLLGLFWGAPLVAHEIETGTFRLAWTQSVTRRRWFLTRVILVVVSAIVASGLFSVMATWWSSPFRHLTLGTFNDFDKTDLVPMGYAAFAVMLGVCAGVVLRRTLPALAATLVAFIAVRVSFSGWVRPRLESPLHATTAFQVPLSNAGRILGKGLNPQDWVTSDTVINAQGRVVGQNGGIGPNGNINFRGLGDGTVRFVGVGVCPGKMPPSGPVRGNGPPSRAAQDFIARCIHHFHLREVLTYQPVSRYWTFQWMEFSLYLLAALALGALSYWWLCRRSN